jgi:hypothetical protein
MAFLDSCAQASAIVYIFWWHQRQIMTIPGNAFRFGQPTPIDFVILANYCTSLSGSDLTQGDGKTD